MQTYIVYACPIGPLAEQIEDYFVKSQKLHGKNEAHRYMPHCTLTGFFHDESASIPMYNAALEAALERARPRQPAQPLRIKELKLAKEFHGLLLDGPWLTALIADFAHTVDSPTRQDALRLKDWLHLSLAYKFPTEQHEPLAQLARELVHIEADVQWELRFYERHADWTWTCHGCLMLDA